MARRGPSARKSSALAGTSIGRASRPAAGGAPGRRRPGGSRRFGLARSTSTRSVRVTGSIASAVRAITPRYRWPGPLRDGQVDGEAGPAAPDSRLGNGDVDAQAFRSPRCGRARAPPLPLPASTSCPMSVLRAVITPSNGASIRSKADELLEPADVRLVAEAVSARRAARALTALSYSCRETAFGRDELLLALFDVRRARSSFAFAVPSLRARLLELLVDLRGRRCPRAAGPSSPRLRCRRTTP